MADSHVVSRNNKQAQVIGLRKKDMKDVLDAAKEATKKPKKSKVK